MMRTSTQASLVAFILMTVIFSSCKTDGPSAAMAEVSQLDGTYKMHKAYKSDQETKLLDNAFFTFTDKTVITNVLGDETPHPYTLKNGKLEIEDGSSNPYNVDLVTPDTLIMTTRIRRFNFKFITVKSQAE